MAAADTTTAVMLQVLKKMKELQCADQETLIKEQRITSKERNSRDKQREF